MAKLFISAVVVTAPSVLSMLILPLLRSFISASVRGVILTSSSRLLAWGSPAVERIGAVVMSPLASRLILPPEPSLENDSKLDSLLLVPALVSIAPPAFRVISPPLLLPLSF